MSCRRAFEIDLAGFLAEPRADAFAGFREHYPRCAACAAEVRAWTELHLRLASGAPAGHPEPAKLLRYEDGGAALAAAERAALEAHLAGCASCRDELAALRAFDPAALGRPAAAGRRGPGALLASLGRLLWHPAFAYALALLVAAPALYLLVGPGGPAEPVDRSLAEREAPAALPAEREPPAALTAEPEAPAPPAARREAAPAPSVALPEERGESLRALGYVDALSADRAAGAEISGPEGPSLERLAGGAFALRVPVAPEAGEVEVRVVSPDGRRELGERFRGGGASVRLRIPAGWLEPGTYSVERRSGGVATRFALPLQAADLAPAP